MDTKIEYEKPQICDYGSVQDLTAGCYGSPRDYHGKNNALEEITSRGWCKSSP